MPLILYVLPVRRLTFSDDVQESVASTQFSVLSVVPLSVIPPPSAAASEGEAVEPSSMFLSSTVRVVELMVVVVPSTVRLPEIVTLLLKLAAPVKVETPATEALPESVTLEDAVRAATAVVPVSVGDAENTTDEEPVSLVSAEARFDDEGVAKNVATLAPRPLIPVDTGRPVQLVNVPEEGVPNTGVVNVGDVKVLLVNVSVVARPIRVSVDVGSVRVPVFEMLEITGVVSVLLVSVSVEEVVTTLTPSTAILPADALEIVVSVACPNSRFPPTAKVFVLASNVKSASVEDAVIVPDVMLVSTTL